MYKPIRNSLQMSTPAFYRPCTKERINGREKKSYGKPFNLMVHYKEKGGSEVVVNGVKVITKTTTAICWYDPRIEQDGRLIIYGKVYEITNAENVEMRNRYLVCSLKYIRAGA